MNPFLKKEWEDTDIPEHVYVRARGRAWEELQRKPARLRLRFAVAGGMAALLIFFLIPGSQVSDEAVPEIPVSAPLGPTASDPPREAPAIQMEPEAFRPPQRVERIRPEAPPLRDPQSPVNENVPDRVVLNFQLPETGVRMIWIMERDFEIGGTR